MQSLVDLLGLAPNDPLVTSHLVTLAESSVIEPDIKTYPDVVYHNYRSLGLSLQFEPLLPQSEEMHLAAIDVYHKASGWSTFPYLPLQFPILPTDQNSISPSKDVVISGSSVGKNFVEQLGEPRRKGGGDAGGGGLGPGLWMEWDLTLVGHLKSVTLLVELSRSSSPKGLRGGGTTWDLDQAGLAPWYTITLQRTK